MKIKNNSLFGESRSPKVRPEKDSTPLDIPVIPEELVMFYLNNSFRIILLLNGVSMDQI
jgi:hypothetical protein